MFNKLRGRVSSAHVIALAALFVALGGTAFAAATVGTKDIKDGAVTTNKIRNQAVTRQKLAQDAVVTKKIKNNAVSTDKIADQAVSTDKIADLAVTTGKLADQAVSTGKIADQAVTNGKLAAGAVTTDKIGNNQVRAANLGPTVIRGTSANITSGDAGLVIATCNGNETMLSGGGVWNNPLTGNKGLKASFPSGNAWVAIGQNQTATTQTFNAYITCLQT